MRPGRNLFAFIAIMLGVGLVPAHADTIQVVIDKLVFSPAEIKAKVGDTIEWVNKDILAHTATVRGDWDARVDLAAGADGGDVVDLGDEDRGGAARFEVFERGLRVR